MYNEDPACTASISSLTKNKLQKSKETYEAKVSGLVHLSHSTNAKDLLNRCTVQIWIHGVHDVKIKLALRLASSYPINRVRSSQPNLKKLSASPLNPKTLETELSRIVMK